MSSGYVFFICISFVVFKIDIAFNLLLPAAAAKALIYIYYEIDFVRQVTSKHRFGLVWEFDVTSQLELL